MLAGDVAIGVEDGVDDRLGGLGRDTYNARSSGERNAIGSIQFFSMAVTCVLPHAVDAVEFDLVCGVAELLAAVQRVGEEDTPLFMRVTSFGLANFLPSKLIATASSSST
jgi:hypothetical protein